MNKIVDTLNRGIIAAEKFIQAPLDWQVHQIGDPITFYFRTDSFVSFSRLRVQRSALQFYSGNSGRCPANMKNTTYCIAYV